MREFAAFGYVYRKVAIAYNFKMFTEEIENCLMIHN